MGMRRGFRFGLGLTAASLALPQYCLAAEPAPVPVPAISAADKAEGAKAHPQLLEEFGGAVAGPQAAYVEQVGRNIAVQSGLGNAKSDFTVTLLNSSVNNAFAIPGGYVYVTRELVGLMNNEAELAAVLGHEVGHVAARHSQKRQQAAQQNALIGVLGSVLSGVILGDSLFGKLGQQVFSQGSQLMTLRYSRSQETEADNLGISYLTKAGYDPRAMGAVLQSLANQNALEAQIQGSQTRVPEWASTHPADGPRVKAALAKAGSGAKGQLNRDKFLAGINGIMWGDDPRQGVIEGRKFLHPDMRIGFEAPAGFYMVNGTRAVAISGQSAKAELSNAAYSGDLSAYVNAAFAALSQNGGSQINPGLVQRTTVNGIPAAYAAARTTSGSSSLDVVVFAYELAKDKAVHFVTLSQAGATTTFDQMFGSMRRLSDVDIAGVRSRKVVVRTVRKGETSASLAAQMAYSDNQLDRFLVLNGLGKDAVLSSGQKIKLITY